LDLLPDRASLLFRIPSRDHPDLFASLAFRAQRLAQPALIVRDQVRSGGENVAGRAIVALEANDFRAGEILLEAQDVVDLSAGPAVDRLIVVADTADVL